MKISKLFPRLILPLSLLISFSELRGQAGNNNPTGPAGFFNGNVTTGCSYDPFTSNSVRKITEMVVANAAGDYGLSYSRTWNSRNPGWHNGYDWSIDDVEDLPNGQPIPYTVNFPDGRSETFGPAGQQGGIWRTTAGVRERLKPWDGTYTYLLLPDGGQVQFKVTSTSYYNGEDHQTYYNFYFSAPLAIIDPFGLRTTFSYNANGTLSKVTEPAGRWIQLFYATISGAQVIDYIKASDGRIVDYTYQTQVFGNIAYTVLTNAVYYGDSSLTATYTYRSANVGSAGYLLATCDDPMYAGPMKKISYTYATTNNPNGTAPVYGQILSEKGGTPLQTVSTLTINSPTTRTETRGDGPARTFTYTNGYLTSWTDFKKISASQTYDSSKYIASVTDQNNRTTNFTRDPLTGNVTLITYPLTPPDTARATVRYVYGSSSCPDPNNRDGNNPYYLYSVTNERGSTTTYTRTAQKRISQINYPDGAYETFTYNGFGQVLSHRMTSGGTESFTYDGRGLRTTRTPPSTPSDQSPGAHPTRYYYDGNDRLRSSTDPFGNATWFDYNQRGQITRVTHQDGSYMQNAYNPDGTLAWTADENHPGAATDPNQRTRYTYDEYKRVLTVTNPMNQTTTNSYALDSAWANPLLHTTNSVKYVVSPMNKNVVYDYDANFRKIDQVAALGTADEAWTLFAYDAVGNLTTTTDPRGNRTSFGYDNRNRQTSVSNALAQTTTTTYDGVGNKVRVTRPDNSFQRGEYDSLNRVIDSYGFGNEHTHYGRDLAGNVTQTIDAKGASYGFSYDTLNRKTSLRYPRDAWNVQRQENWSYDSAGNLATFQNRGGAVQTFGYDNRNREIHFGWNDGTMWRDIGYDAASRVLRLSNYDADVDFTYDEANRMLMDKQTNHWTNTAHSVTSTYDADGDRSRAGLSRRLGLHLCLHSAPSVAHDQRHRPSGLGEHRAV